MAITIERAGARVYLVGDTFPIKDAIKAIGGHWDGDRRAWWVGAAKMADAEALAGKAAAPGAASPPANADDVKVIGKAEYKGRNYYVRWAGICKSGADKIHLTSLDGKIDFWADAALCRWVKHYEAREYRGRTEPVTLGSIKRFINRAKRDEKSSAHGDAGWRSNGCSECRALGDWCKRCAFDEFDN